MSTTILTPEEASRKQAELAVKRFRQQIPSYRTFARALTKNHNVHISLGPPSTDGKMIYLTPPFELGDPDASHDRNLCGVTQNGKPICDMCRLSEDTLAVVCHEISHIVFESFEDVQPGRVRKLLDQALSEHRKSVQGTLEKLEDDDSIDDDELYEKTTKLLEAETRMLDRVTAEVNKLGTRGSSSYMEAASIVSPFLPILQNALEDARVNARMFEARPGVKRMFENNQNDILEYGSTQMDGSKSRWSDAPINAQAAIVAYCEASGLVTEDHWFDDDLDELVEDAEFKRLCGEARSAKGIETIYQLSYDLLQVIREHGYMLPPEVQEEMERQMQQGMAQGDEDDDSASGQAGGSASGSGGGSEDDDDTAGGAGSSGDDDDASDDDNGAGGGSDGDDPNDGDDDNDGAGSGEDEDDPNGSAQAVQDLLDQFSGHQPSGDEDDDDNGQMPTRKNPIQPSNSPAGGPQHLANAAEDMERAIQHAEEFDKSVPTIDRVWVHTEAYEHPSTHRYMQHGRTTALAWDPDNRSNNWYTRQINETQLVALENVLGPCVGLARITFDENKRSVRDTGRKSGPNLVGRHLHRVKTSGNDQPRVFGKRTRPGKRDYFVMIGMDTSGSTAIDRLQLEKQIVYNLAELLHRVRIPFALYAHNGYDSERSYHLFDVDIVHIKSAEQLSDEKARERLRTLMPGGCNLDGHTLHWYRRKLEQVDATDKILMYFNDGECPAANYNAELSALQEEIARLDQLGIHRMGVGIQSDDLSTHGFDTLRADSPEDLPAIIRGLKDRITR